MESDAEDGLRKVLSRMSGYRIGSRAYVSYFENEHGENLIFVREPDAAAAVLLHSDLDWNPKLVTGPPKAGALAEELSPRVRQFLGDVPVVGDLILNGPEALWLKACLVASESL